MSTSTPDSSPDSTPDSPLPAPSPAWPLLPNETEIYILPDGQVIIADLPAELAGLADGLGRVQADPVPIADNPHIDSQSPA